MPTSRPVTLSDYYRRRRSYPDQGSDVYSDRLNIDYGSGQRPNLSSYASIVKSANVPTTKEIAAEQNKNKKQQQQQGGGNAGAAAAGSAAEHLAEDYFESEATGAAGGTAAQQGAAALGGQAGSAAAAEQGAASAGTAAAGGEAASSGFGGSLGGAAGAGAAAAAFAALAAHAIYMEQRHSKHKLYNLNEENRLKEKGIESMGTPFYQDAKQAYNNDYGADYVGYDKQGKWVNNKFITTRNEADIRAEDIVNSPSFSRLYGNDWVHASPEARRAIAEEALRRGTVTEDHLLHYGIIPDKNVDEVAKKYGLDSSHGVRGQVRDNSPDEGRYEYAYDSAGVGSYKRGAIGTYVVDPLTGRLTFRGADTPDDYKGDDFATFQKKREEALAIFKKKHAKERAEAQGYQSPYDIPETPAAPAPAAAAAPKPAPSSSSNKKPKKDQDNDTSGPATLPTPITPPVQVEPSEQPGYHGIDPSIYKAAYGDMLNTMYKNKGVYA